MRQRILGIANLFTFRKAAQLQQQQQQQPTHPRSTDSLTYLQAAV